MYKKEKEKYAKYKLSGFHGIWFLHYKDRIDYGKIGKSHHYGKETWGIY